MSPLFTLIYQQYCSFAWVFFYNPFTNGCDDSPSKEKSRAQVPQAAVICESPYRVYSRAHGRDNILETEKS